MAALANLIQRIDQFADSDPLVRRIISAIVRVGKKANAETLGKFAANKTFDEARRVEAVNALGAWTAPPARDLVLHAWRPLDPSKRNVLDARNSIKNNFVTLTNSSEALTSAAIAAAGNLNLTEIGKELEVVALAPATSEMTRVAAITSLGQFKYSGLPKILSELESNFDSLPPVLASQVIKLIASEDETRGLALIESAMNRGQQETKQSALETMGSMKSVSSAAMLNSFLQRMIADDFPNVALAAESRAEDSIRQQLSKYTSATLNPDEPGSGYLDTLVGGNNDVGSKIFYGKTEVSCVRCHRIDGTGGEVGPDLSGIGLKRDRKYLMESIVHPNKEIAEGYTQVKVQTDDGVLHVGIVKKETDDYLVLLDADGKEIVLEQDSIEGVKPGQSSMPADLIKQLSKKEVRDLVEFLAYRKSPAPEKKTEHE
jgi:quinoprotein glucose dehydrogenase